MKRFSSNDILQLGNIYEGTSAAFIGYNTKTGRKGIYKNNGCMIGITNEDIREKLASEIFDIVGIDHADIDLVYEEATKENACFSNYIISDNEELVTPRAPFIQGSSEDLLENCFEMYINGVKNFSNNEDLLKSCRTNFFNYIYMGCIIDSYDLKPDNLPLIYNKTTGEYSTSPWFDFGTAFKEDAIQRQSVFNYLTTDEIMQNLYNHHYNDISEISNKVHSTLTREKIQELFTRDYLLETLEPKEISDIKNRLLSQLTKSQKLEASINQVPKNSTKFSLLFKKFFNKLTTKLNITKQLPPSKQSDIPSETFNNNTSNKLNDLSQFVNDTIDPATYLSNDSSCPKIDKEI